MGISWGETIAEDPPSVVNANATTWGVSWVGICYSDWASPVVPVQCAVAEVVKPVKSTTTRSLSWSTTLTCGILQWNWKGHIHRAP